MKPLEKVIDTLDSATETSSGGYCQFFEFEDYTNQKGQTPAGYTAITDLVQEWEKDEKLRSEMEKARRWVAKTFYDEEGDTVRSLRLNKGWSQIRLAQEIGTSQSHVARIERGTENIAISTVRRLCRALEVDVNTLDQALRRQESITQAKVSRK